MLGTIISLLDNTMKQLNSNLILALPQGRRHGEGGRGHSGPCPLLDPGVAPHYLLPEMSDRDITDKLRIAKTFKLLPARTERFRKSFIAHCIANYQ